MRPTPRLCVAIALIVCFCAACGDDGTTEETDPNNNATNNATTNSGTTGTNNGTTSTNANTSTNTGTTGTNNATGTNTTGDPTPWRFVRIEDLSARESGRQPGADIDAIELIAPNGTSYFATTVEDFQLGGGDALDSSQSLGAPDSNCDANTSTFLALGGQEAGAYLIVGFSTSARDVNFGEGWTITVHELGDTMCGDGTDDNPYAVAISESSQVASFVEIGRGDGLTSFVVGSYAPNPNRCDPAFDGPDCVCFSDTTDALCDPDADGPDCVCDFVYPECDPDFNGEACVCTDSDGEACNPYADRDCGCVFEGSTGEGWRYVRIGDLSTDGSSEHPGADIDAVELTSPNGTSYFATTVEDLQLGGGVAIDSIQSLGMPDAECSLDAGNHVSLGGEDAAGYLIVGFSDSADVAFGEGWTITVHEIDEQMCTGDDIVDTYTVAISDSTAVASFVELGMSGGVSTFDVIPYAPNPNQCDPDVNGPDCVCFDATDTVCAPADGDVSCVCDYLYLSCDPGFDGEACVCTDSVGETCDPYATRDCGCIFEGDPNGDGWRYVLIEDLSENAVGDYPGIDVDAIELVTSGGTSFFAVTVEDFAFGDGAAIDATQMLGAPDSNCDPSSGAFTAFGGADIGGYAVVTFNTTFASGAALSVHELGFSMCGQFDDDPYAIAVATEFDAFVEVGTGVGLELIPVTFDP